MSATDIMQDISIMCLSVAVIINTLTISRLRNRE